MCVCEMPVSVTGCAPRILWSRVLLFIFARGWRQQSFPLYAYKVSHITAYAHVNYAPLYECAASYVKRCLSRGAHRESRQFVNCLLLPVPKRDLCMRPLRRSVNYRLWRHAATISTSKPQTRRSFWDVHAENQFILN